MAVFGILFVIPFYIGFFFWFYWPVALLLAALARNALRGFTTALFLLACALQVGVYALFVAFALAASLFSMIPSAGPVLMLVFLAVLSLGGVVGWVVLLVKRLRRGSEVRAFHQRHPRPRLQCSMQDIYTAVFYFACAMAFWTLVMNAAMGSPEEYMLLLLAFYLFISTALGFYIALDVLRCKTTAWNAWARAGTVLFSVFFTSISGMVFMLTAWRAWQRAMLFTTMERDRKTLAEEKARLRKQKRAQASGDAGVVKPAPISPSPPPTQ